MNRKLLLATVLLFAVGCAPASPVTDTGPATPALISPEALSATPEAEETDSVTPSEVEAENLVSFDEMGFAVGFDYPEGFTQGASTGVLGVYEPNAPFELPYPAHARILFTAYANGSEDITAAGIRVFRIDEINALQAGVVENLSAVREGQADHHNDFPRLAGAGNVIDAQLSPVDFKNGTGYRFLLTKSFSADPLSSTSMTYMYQGVTNDEKYFLSFLVGVDAPFLTPYLNQPLTTVEEFESFYSNVNTLIDTSAPDQFLPSLDVLDELVSSVVIIEK
ncbi:MAG: hypothetical protein DYG86_18780 [Chloroflexi bacterium CFX2]|nr:hypothetical protein [Chloroflexi bacterium CFX2]